MYIVKGYKKNSGTLDNGKPWNNYSLFCLRKNDDVVGYSCQVIKVPTKILQETFSSPDDIIDKDINVLYDIRTYDGRVVPVVVGIDIIN